MAENLIRVRGARANNLKNIDIDIPKDKLVVITGLSGSGKSSLAFDTIYAEGQRRYVESLSSYARQFLGLMEKPDVDLIEGLSPAISIDQKSAGHNPRSTVGTITEIYDYLRLLYARVGHARSPVSGKRLKNQTVTEIVDAIVTMPEVRKVSDVKIMLLAPLVKDRKGTYEELFQRYLAQGFVRARVDGQVYQLEEKIKLDRYVKHNIDLVVDRLAIKKDAGSDVEFRKRLVDSVELTLKHGEGEMLVHLVDQKEDVFFSEKLVDPATGQSFSEIEPHTFSFNSPHGACPTCNGLGFIKEVDPRAVLDMPRYGCVNIHASLLPRWRGAAPIQRAIEAGDTETGITIMQMDEGLDTGAMLAKESIPIELDDTAATLHDRLAQMGARMIVSVLQQMEQGLLSVTPQPEAGANYAAKIMKDEAPLDFSLSAALAARRINAFNPFPGASAMFNGVQVKLWRAEPVAESSAGKPGEVLAANPQDGVLIACGGQVLRVTELQKPGGKRLPAKEFVKGFPMEGGFFSDSGMQ